MTWEQYWYGDVWMVEAFRETNRIKQEIKNQNFWLQGMYFYDALSCVAHNALNRKGTKLAKYPEKPYELGKKEQWENEQIAENERLKAQLFFRNWARSVQKKFK